MYEKELQNLGLSEKESKVYLTALEMGAETAQNIAKKANINRATTYVQIDSLKLKGLMSEFEKGKKTFYVAESPERLSGLLNLFEKELELKKSEADRILPGLLDMFSGMGERPKVRFFEGIEGARAMDEEMLHVKSNIVWGLIDLDKLFNYYPGQEEVTKYRIQKKIKSKIIYTRSQGPLATANDPDHFREAKFVAKEKMPLSAEINIYDNKVSMITYNSRIVGVIIDNQNIADTVRSLFEFVWRTL
jgi:sugar-specific transcriptional regulator TrmB